MRRINRFISIIFCIALTASCASDPHELFKPKTPDLIDPELGLTRSDYRNVNDPNAFKKAAGGAGSETESGMTEPPVPDLAEILTSPRPPKLGDTKLVSIAVTDDIPLKDVIIELARLADVDVEIDATISGGI